MVLLLLFDSSDSLPDRSKVSSLLFVLLVGTFIGFSILDHMVFSAL